MIGLDYSFLVWICWLKQNSSGISDKWDFGLVRLRAEQFYTDVHMQTRVDPRGPMWTHADPPVPFCG